MAVLIKNVTTYQKTKPVYDAYRKAKDKAAYRRLTEQPFEQGNENAANQGNAAARHKLLHALRFCLCVIKK